MTSSHCLIFVCLDQQFLCHNWHILCVRLQWKADRRQETKGGKQPDTNGGKPVPFLKIQTSEIFLSSLKIHENWNRDLTRSSFVEPQSNTLSWNCLKKNSAIPLVWENKLLQRSLPFSFFIGCSFIFYICLQTPSNVKYVTLKVAGE